MEPASSGSAASSRSWSSVGDAGGTPRAVSARRRDGVGRNFLSGAAKRAKASLISDSVAAEMECSFARADWRGVFSLEGGGAAAPRRLGGYERMLAIGLWWCRN